MPTNVIPGAVGYPLSLGKVFPGASFASQSAPLTQNIQPVKMDGSKDNNFSGVFIQAHTENSGNIYICSNSAAPDLVAYTNVLAEVMAGGTYPRGKEWANNRDISKLFIGAGNATDFAIVSIDAF
jgi:hypothetical protein